MYADETRCALMLARMGFYHIPQVRQLYDKIGSFAGIVARQGELRDLAPGCPGRLTDAFGKADEYRRQAEEEMAFAAANGIQVITLTDSAYPRLLRDCPDAPLVLFFKGQADLNTPHSISIVGTRKATPYADDCVAQLVRQLKTLCPDMLIVSGLAYGVDVMAHRHAISEGMGTVAVLAHGMDTLYPARHRKEAVQMQENGGLLTEYFAHAVIDKRNFIRRNRIIAGMTAATLLVESPDHGGGLVTCGIAQSYQRDVFAFPGNINSPCSAGCNRLIRDNVAGLVTSAEDLLKAMGWYEEKRETAHVPYQGTTPLPDGSQPIVGTLAQENDLHIDMIATRTGLPVSNVLSLLFQLEMAGMVSPLSGGRYHLKQ